MRRRKPRGSLRRPAFKYRNRYGLIIEQPSERDQRREFNRLKCKGYKFDAHGRQTLPWVAPGRPMYVRTYATSVAFYFQTNAAPGPDVA